MSEKIIIVIAPDGSIKSTTEGFKGSSCTDASKFLEKALGQKLSDVKTSEYYEEPNTEKERANA